MAPRVRATAPTPSNPSGAQRLATSPITSATPTKVNEPAMDFVPRQTVHRGLPIRSPTVAAAGSARANVITPSPYAAGCDQLNIAAIARPSGNNVAPSV